MVSGCLYSIGVGPGDPELMTLKAVHTISKCPVLGFAGGEPPKVRGLSDRKTDFAGNR